MTLQRLLLRVAALDACWVASSLGRSGPFQQCKKSGRAKSAVLELDLRLGVTALPHVSISAVQEKRAGQVSRSRVGFETWCYGAPTRATCINLSYGRVPFQSLALKCFEHVFLCDFATVVAESCCAGRLLGR